MSEDGGAGFIGQADANTMHDGPLVIDLVTRARTGDKRSWDALVERYAPGDRHLGEPGARGSHRAHLPPQ